VFFLFGLLKKKIGGFAEKIFGKSKSKIIKEEPIFENKDLVEESNVSSKKNSNSKETTFDTIKSDYVSEKSNDFLENNKFLETNINKEDSKDVSSKFILDEKENDLDNKNIKEKKAVYSKIPDISKLDTVNKDQNVSKEKISNKMHQKDVEEKDKSNEYKSLDLEKKEKVKKNVITSIKSVFSNKIKISESEISSFLEEFEFSLLEADVSIDSACSIVNDLKKSLTSVSFNKNNLMKDINDQIKITLKNQLNIDCNINNYIKNTKKENEPYVILFIGPNGVGKTTTIAKLAKKYKDQNKKVILSSSDTFRAGSIQQLEKHATNLDVRIVKQNYGSDPAAVAYDAVSAAKSSKADFVLIDTAGRQETNHNLMQELEKINRVIKPNLTIYVAESQAGQAIIDQIKKFDEVIGISGVVLTKIDTDPKGGVAISILNELKKPIFYIGTGQEYNDLISFSAEYIIDRIVE
jgi:fused signal recognition particle receptor